MSRTRVTDPVLLYQLLPLLARGLSDAEMATELGLSLRGVGARMSGLLAHLGARNRTQAVAKAYERALLIPGWLTQSGAGKDSS